MPCQEWRTLLERCYRAEQAYQQAIAGSTGLTGSEFDCAEEKAAQARRECLECDETLLRHEQAHGCLGQQTPGAS
jgi:hypothetical protein